MIKKISMIHVLLLFVSSGFINDSYSDELSGKRLFEEKNCVRCHTIGRGRFVGPDLYNVKDRYEEKDIVNWITNPQMIYQKLNKMPVNEGYPPMPKLNISGTDAREITEFLISNKIKKTDKSGGTIKGEVINKTTGKSVEGIDIYLQSFMGDRKTGEKLSISDEVGGFSFKDLKWSNSYSLKLRLNGVEYETTKVVFPPDKEVIDLNLPIFDVSKSGSDIVTNFNHQFIEVENKIISVVEIYEFENTGNTVFIGEKDSGSNFNKTTKLNIPKEAQNLKFIQGIDGGSAKRKDDTVYDTAGFLPGKKRVVVTYELPLSFGRNQIRKVFYYDTKAMIIMATESSNIKVAGLNEMERIFVHNQNYLRWVGKDIKQKSKIKMNHYSTNLEFKKIELYPIMIFAFLFLSAFVYSLTVNSKNKRLSSKYLLEKREKIITEMAQLDIKYENGEIDSDKYKIIRSELKKSILLLEGREKDVNT